MATTKKTTKKKINFTIRRIRNKVNVDPEYRYRSPHLREDTKPFFNALQIDEDTWYVRRYEGLHEGAEVGLIRRVKQPSDTPRFDAETYDGDDVVAKTSHEDLKSAVVALGGRFKKQKEQHAKIHENVVDLAQRRKRAIVMRVHAPKLKSRREMFRRRMPTSELIAKRAEIIARDVFRKKVAGQRGAQYHHLSASERIMIDKMIDSKAPQIRKLAVRLRPKVRQAASLKMAHAMVPKLAILPKIITTPSGSLKEDMKESWDDHEKLFDTVSTLIDHQETH